jgi:DnaJ-like protein
MPFDRIAEMKIREAMAEGAFDDLPNAGQPLDLEDYFETPADLRMAHSILKSAGVVPVEVELLNELAVLEQRLRETTGAERAAAERAVADARLRLALRLEALRRDRKLP